MDEFKLDRVEPAERCHGVRKNSFQSVLNKTFVWMRAAHHHLSEFTIHRVRIWMTVHRTKRAKNCKTKQEIISYQSMAVIVGISWEKYLEINCFKKMSFIISLLKEKNVISNVKHSPVIYLKHWSVRHHQTLVANLLLW